MQKEPFSFGAPTTRQRPAAAKLAAPQPPSKHEKRRLIAVFFHTPVSHAPQGRGGSVSRRDHSPKTRKRAHVSWARKFAGKVKPIPSRSSGERGLGGEGLLSEKPPLPPESPPPLSSLEEGARGRGLFYQKRPLPRKTCTHSLSFLLEALTFDGGACIMDSVVL